jgi:hypothetical protein
MYRPAADDVACLHWTLSTATTDCSKRLFTALVSVTLTSDTCRHATGCDNVLRVLISRLPRLL